jgi:FemAB-related protein (PEP-CTERM system-associated)
LTLLLLPPRGLQAPPGSALDVRLHAGRDLDAQLLRLANYATRGEQVPLSRHPGWLRVFRDSLGHTAYCLEAVEGGETRGVLPLAYVRSLLFGRFLVSLPYLNTNGVIADHEAAAAALIDRAVGLADEFKVRHLELRHERPTNHAALAHSRDDKAHMRLELAATPGKLWDQIPSKVRNQVRKGEKSGLEVTWGGHDQLSAYYAVFSRNMRDLGTPVYSKRLFARVLDEFPERAELCVVRAGKLPVACALLLHGWGVTEVPSASSLRSHNHTCANMLMYWHLLARAVERGQAVFDFGRSSKDGPTYRFKKQWGAEPHSAEWRYYLRSGGVRDLCADNPRYQRMVRIWQWLPVGLTRLIGPRIVRGIP